MDLDLFGKDSPQTADTTRLNQRQIASYDHKLDFACTAEISVLSVGLDLSSLTVNQMYYLP